MPGILFFGTWGVMFIAALVGFLGYCACKSRRECISVFYALCPALLIVAFLVFVNLRDIVRALTP